MSLSLVTYCELHQRTSSSLANFSKLHGQLGPVLVDHCPTKALTPQSRPCAPSGFALSGVCTGKCCLPVDRFTQYGYFKGFLYVYPHVLL